jgi:alpha-beta hydrolase superfamily lysophospholipase
MTAEALEKVPLYFGTADRPLFGFYHPPAGPDLRSMAVLLCNPLGDEMTRAHRSFRHLAEALAAAGFPVLRFDFDGTGDSAGSERDPRRAATWRGDVGRAAGELRKRSGRQSLALVGLKLGATFAMLGAEDLGGVDALVLWGPFENGTAFVKEVTRAHKMHTMLEPQSFSGGPPASDGQEALGFMLTTPTIEELGGVDLLATQRSPARRTLLIDTANTATPDNALLAHLKKLGGVVSHRHMPGQKFLITSPQYSEVPLATISTITEWLTEESPAAGQAPALAPAAAPTPMSSLRERPVTFGGARRLFGILSTPPAGRERADLPIIIMLNAGTVHRVGSHRLYVPLARQWAELGFKVLRVDLSGIGDSPVPAGSKENLTYPRDGIDDIRAAMDFLTETTKVSRFIVTGLCSGGDLAFQMGVKEPRVAGSIMINPRTFLVNDLSMVDSYEQARWHQGSLANRESWLKLLRGDVNVARALRIVAPKVKDMVVQRATRAVSTILGSAMGGPGGAAPRRETDVPGCLRFMAERGVDTFLLVSEHDPGVEYVDANYSRPMRELAGLSGFRRVDVPGTDHTFTAQWAQARVSETITEHLKQRYLAANAA